MSGVTCVLGSGLWKARVLETGLFWVCRPQCCLRQPRAQSRTQEQRQMQGKPGGMSWWRGPGRCPAGGAAAGCLPPSPGRVSPRCLPPAEPSPWRDAPASGPLRPGSEVCAALPACGAQQGQRWGVGGARPCGQSASACSASSAVRRDAGHRLRAGLENEPS